jgi:hypothetical protein
MRRLLALLLLPLLSGCFQSTFVDPNLTPGEQHDPWTHFFLWGLVGEADIDVRELCPGEVQSVGFGQNFGNWAVSVVTLGIYTPRKVYVTCAEGGAPPATAIIETDATGRPTRVTEVRDGRARAGVPVEVAGAPGQYRVTLAPTEVW